MINLGVNTQFAVVKWIIEDQEFLLNWTLFLLFPIVDFRKNKKTNFFYLTLCLKKKSEELYQVIKDNSGRKLDLNIILRRKIWINKEKALERRTIEIREFFISERSKEK